MEHLVKVLHSNCLYSQNESDTHSQMHVEFSEIIYVSSALKKILQIAMTMLPKEK